jgi:hypothetical protein
LVFLTSDGGDGVARTVAGLLQAECDGLGVDGVVVEADLPDDRPDQVDVVVTSGSASPLPPALAADENRLRRTLLVTCDRSTNSVFDDVVAAAARCGGRFATDVATAEAMTARWAAADFLPLGYTAAQDAWAAPGPRDLDVVFLGPPTERREAAARAFAAGRPELRVVGCGLPDPAAPVRAGVDFVTAQRAALRRARVAVLVHPARADEGTEWFGATEAILAGAALVMERPVDLAPLKAGRDVLTARAASLPLVVDAVLDDAARIAGLRRAGYALLRGAPPLGAAVGQLLGRAWELRASTWRAPAMKA